MRALLCSLLLLACLASCRGEAAPRDVWRFAIEETADSVQDSYAQRFKQRIEAVTDGRVQVEVYRYGELGTSDHLLEQLHDGTLQFAMSSPGHLGKLIPAVQAFLLHFTLHADEAVNRCALADPALAHELDGLYARKGLAFLDAFSEGFMVWTSRRPIREPHDFAGMRMRVMTSPLLLAMYAAYGASPTPLPYGEVYSALQLRMIDGQVNPLFAIQEMSFHEVTDWLTYADHAPFVTTVASSQRALARLSQADRTRVREVIAELHAYIDDVQRTLNRERLARILAQRPDMRQHHLDAAERGEFEHLARPVRDRFIAMAGEPGRALLGTLDRAVARCAP